MASIAALGVGSGLDLNGLLKQLESAERQRLQPITLQKRSFEAKISAYGKLEGALSQFQDAVKKLGAAETFGASTSSVTGDSVLAAATNAAPTGSYSVSVGQLARAYSVATNGVADKTAELGVGTISFTLGDGTAHTVDVAAGSTSLEAIRDTINNQQNDVRASLVNDGSGTPNRLVFSSAVSGTDKAISSLTYGGDLAANLSSDAATEITAQNAALSVNGINVTSQTNQVAGAIEGVTLSLTKAGDSTVTVNRDQEAISGAVTEFVEAYNNIQKTIGDLSSFNSETGSAGQLLGDSGLRSVEGRLRTALSNSVPEANLKTLSELGITRQLDGTLVVDEERLTQLSTDQVGDLQAFFAGTGTAEGFASKTATAVGQLLGENGLITTGTEGFKNMLSRLDDRYIREEERIASTIDRYRTQFGQLDSLIASMNSTSSYLTQQFAALDAQLGRK
ncbi:flagellar hook protein [Pseudidiomarina salinarum]|uniref:Flagellar hook-associated protein 2 n=1 Tax=Pseudidiomarina salinarum TaxID=435908 RepID=A0A094L819_9GAMM|nr:flagellar filament capping protein FliD [Pseudidiomarina salinarum]KFZ30928.1 flagellar hook protein [Pseudidiomarina salinarum]RUO71415.1 flagellar hook protein [Pseudidiomarina salinarum]